MKCTLVSSLLTNDVVPSPRMTREDDMDFDEPVPDKRVSGTDLIDMAFSKGRVEDRKEWLNNMEKDTFLNYSEAQGHGVKFSDFVNKELILFSQADNQRSIPHVMDGFKPSQRKVLFACFKRKLKGEIKGRTACRIHWRALCLPSWRSIAQWYHREHGSVLLWI